MGRFLSRANDFDVERAITAMIVCPTLEDAVEVLKLQGTPATVDWLRVWRDRDPIVKERYQHRREELAPQLEGMFANDLLDNARMATLAVKLAIEKTEELLTAGKVGDPSRIARDLSQVMAQSLDKRLAVQGRPTQIVENRDVGEILRKLQALGVIEVVERTAGEVEAHGVDK
jgi:hypothetical protein